MLEALAFVALATFAVGALAYAVLQPRIERNRKAAVRLTQYARVETDGAARTSARDRVAETVKRRKSIQNSLKELDERQRERSRQATRPSMRRRMEQAGLSITERQFVLGSAASGLGCGVVALLASGAPLVALGALFVGSLGLPRLVVNVLRVRRLKRFTAEFPNAIDLIVRGVKSGLPVNDTFRMIAGEAAEPVRSEFRKIVEAQQVGIATAEAVERLYANMPLPETNFFAIVISIQAQAGGNLSEALGNLSRVLRERRKMKMKVQAMSMEAKASAGIIGSLPAAVAGLIYLTTPDYISLLFMHPTGHLILLCSAVWMSIGIVVMRQMINFDF